MSTPVSFANYNWSVNIVQSIIAFVEGLVIGFKAPKSAVLAAVILVSSALPDAGFVGMNYNEKLWETVIATLLGGAILTGVYDGGFIKNAIMAFIVDTSSMAVTDEIYNSYILGGANPSVFAQRAAYPAANGLNRVALG